MAVTGEVKLKLLYLLEVLKSKTDEQNPLTGEELAMEIMQLSGIKVERKSLYSDITILQEFGYNIIKTSYPRRGFFLASRDFEIPEIRLISDAIQSASFITSKKTNIIIEKLKTQVSTHQAKNIFSQVYISDRFKHKNEEIYYNIEKINVGITIRKKISFDYYRRKVNESGKIINDIKRFCISPYAFIWNNDHYYIVGNYEKYDNLMNLRIDRIKNVEILTTPIRDFSEVSDYKQYFDTADYANKTFNMFDGVTSKIELRCSDLIIEQVFDKFGEKVTMRRSGEHHFVISADTIISDGLVGWILQYNTNIEVLSPLTLRQNIIDKVISVGLMYKLVL